MYRVSNATNWTLINPLCDKTIHHRCQAMDSELFRKLFASIPPFAVSLIGYVFRVRWRFLLRWSLSRDFSASRPGVNDVVWSNLIGATTDCVQISVRKSWSFPLTVPRCLGTNESSRKGKRFAVKCKNGIRVVSLCALLENVRSRTWMTSQAKNTSEMGTIPARYEICLLFDDNVYSRM